MMVWTSWADFWAMGGRGFYVWASFGLTFVLLAAESMIEARRWQQCQRHLRQSHDLTASAAAVLIDEPSQDNRHD